MTWAIGRVLQGGRYVIEEVLGRGEFGITYRALQVKLNRQVVIKTTHDYLHYDPEYDKYIKGFITEGRTLARLTQDPHPHIVGVIELFKEGNTHCLVMEFVPGENLFQVVKRRGALPEAEIVRCIHQIGEALMVVHQAGLVHRDAHPGNIMLRSNGRAVLIDFGIAKQIIPATQSSTNKDANRGFAPYEQICRGSREPTVDVYCLAATLYYAVTGQKPIPSLARKLDNEPLIPPQQIIPNVSDRLNQAILNGMALEAKDRPQSMQAWLEMLSDEAEVSISNPEILSYQAVVLSIAGGLPNSIMDSMDSLGKAFRSSGVEVWSSSIAARTVAKYFPSFIDASVDLAKAIQSVEHEVATSVPEVLKVTSLAQVKEDNRKEVVRSTSELKIKTTHNKLIRTIPWSWLVGYLGVYGCMGYLLPVSHPLFWDVAVTITITLVLAVAVVAEYRGRAWTVALAKALPVISRVGLMVGVALFAAIGALQALSSVWLVVAGALFFVAWPIAVACKNELRKFFNKFHTYLILTCTSSSGLALGLILNKLFHSPS